MLVFVIPLKSAQVSNSWERVSKLFQRCIRSVCNQTSTNFRVVVVCHEQPQIEFNHPHITYLKADFPTPAPDIQSKRLDKIQKILVGLKYAKQFQPSHTMIVDADDCVSKHLAEFVEQNIQGNGWFVNRGYLYQIGSKFTYFKRRDFQKWCGTSHIVKYDLIHLPKTLDDDVESEKYYFISHRELQGKLSRQGTPLEPLPFAGVVYIIGNGDNIFGDFKKFFPKQGIVAYLKKMLFMRPLTSSLRTEFSLYDTN